MRFTWQVPVVKYQVSVCRPPGVVGFQGEADVESSDQNLLVTPSAVVEGVSFVEKRDRLSTSPAKPHCSSVIFRGKWR